MDNFEFTNEEIKIIKAVIRDKFSFMITNYYDDLYSLGMYEVWMKRDEFDPSYGVKYSTFLYNKIYSRLLVYKRKQFDSKSGVGRRNTLSLNFEHDENLELEDSIPSTTLDFVYDDLELNGFLEKLTDMEKSIVNGLLNGYSLREIGLDYNLTSQAIGLRKKKIKEKYNRYMEVAV